MASGAGASGGPIQIQSGSGFSNGGGSIAIVAGAGISDGGSISLSSGPTGGDGISGKINLRTADSHGSGGIDISTGNSIELSPGVVVLHGGDALASSSVASTVSISAGSHPVLGYFRQTVFKWT